MKIQDKIQLIKRADDLIKECNTGSPSTFASKLDLSERGIYNLLNLMRQLGAPIYYSKEEGSYCYKQNVIFSVGFSKSNRNKRKLNY